MKISLCLMAMPLAILLNSGLANATLGEGKESIASNRTALKAVAKAQSFDVSKGYSIDESTFAGSTIRQYSNASGVVFAITWDGVSNPDLAVLMGSFHDRYVTALKSKKMVRRSQLSETKADGLVVRRSGHMRAWHGQIIATDLLPSGVSAEDIQ